MITALYIGLWIFVGGIVAASASVFKEFINMDNFFDDEDESPLLFLIGLVWPIFLCMCFGIVIYNGTKFLLKELFKNIKNDTYY
jgi:uncharacterized membrane protein